MKAIICSVCKQPMGVLSSGIPEYPVCTPCCYTIRMFCHVVLKRESPIPKMYFSSISNMKHPPELPHFAVCKWIDENKGLTF